MTRKVFQADFGSQADQMVLSAPTNPIHNGGFGVWQRGTSFASGLSEYTADRWYYLNIAAVVHAVQRSTDVPAVAALVPLSSYSMHLDVTTADAAVAAGDLCALTQRIEGYVWAPFAQQVLTVGFWVKDTITGTHCVALHNGAQDRSCVMEYTVSVADTWEYKTVTFPASPSAGTWDYTTGIGAYLWFPLIAGSTYQTTAGAWQAAERYATAAMVNSVSSTANNFKLWGVTLGLGTTVAPFWPRSFGEELACCQRYAYVLPAGITSAYLGGMPLTSQATGRVSLPADMRTAPTLSHNVATLGTTAPTGTQAAVFDYRLNNFLAGGTFSSLAAWAVGPRAATFYIASSTPFTSAVAGDVAEVYLGSGVVITLSADL